MMVNGSSLVLPGDAVTVLAGIPDEWCQCVVTSPPYWGLRDYGTAQWEWGEAGCDHLAPATGSTQNKCNNGKFGSPFRDLCGKCGARRIDQQLGLESTPEEYVHKMVEGFRGVRRVLRKDGTLWLNLGDSTQSKQLTGIPWRVALALQADGWILRQDIIWSKPNPMPESVTDRCTKAHEYLFLLTKSKKYYYDAEAIKEAAREGAKVFNGKHSGNIDRQDNGRSDTTTTTTRNRRTVWTIPTRPFRGAHFATFPPKLIEPCILAGSRPGDVVLDPFCGSGTVGAVCCPLGRDFIGIDLNPDYCQMAEDRIRSSLDVVGVIK